MTDMRMVIRTAVFLAGFVLIQSLAACNTGRIPAVTDTADTNKVAATTAPVSTPEPESGVDTNNKLEIHFLDAGNGECSVLFTPDGKTLLVDGGTDGFGQVVIAFLRSRNVRKLDVVVSSHPDANRIGGLDEIIREFKVDRFLTPPIGNDIPAFTDMLTALSDFNIKQETARAGLEVQLGSQVQLRFFAPVGAGYDHLNDYSAVFQVKYGNTSVLFTGDAENVSEKQMLDSAAPLNSTILKAANNGSSASTSQEFLNAAAPKYAVIFTNSGDTAVPSKVWLDRLNQLKVKWYKTGECGTVSFYSDGNAVDLKTAKSPPKRT